MSCDKSFFKKDDLRAHMRTHEVTDKDHLICDECGMKLKSKSSLYNHRNMVHKHKVFECSLCSKAFASKWKGIRRGVGYHKSESGVRRYSKELICLDFERKRRFKCDRSGNMFLELKYLREHKKYKHEGERYQYDKCAHFFCSQKNL